MGFSVWTGCNTLTKWSRVYTPLTPLMACCQGFLFGPGPESTGSGTGASWGPRHALHHYASCVWLRNPQLRWPLSQALGSFALECKYTHRQLCCLLDMWPSMQLPCHWSHIYMSASKSVLGETFKAERMLGFRHSGGVFPGCKQRCLNRNDIWLQCSFHTCYQQGRMCLASVKRGH